jgi:two-component system chemotaxis response regulator CheY
MSGKRVLSVGQCGADHGGINWSLRGEFDADVVAAATADEALRLLKGKSFALVLVNRVFDYDGSSGLDLIRRLKADETLRHIPVMLVSNYADAQADAEKAGAVPGFGKAELGREEMFERVRPFLTDEEMG